MRQRWLWVPGLIGMALLRPAWGESGFPLEALSARLEAVAERRAHFTETRYLQALAAPLHSVGELVYRRPDYLEKVTNAPAPETMVAQGDRLTVTADGGAPQVIALGAQPEARALVDTIRGALSGDLPLLRRYYSIAGDGILSGWSLRLTPVDPAVRRVLRSVRIDGAGTDLLFIQIVQANGDEDRMSISPAS